MKYTMDDVLVGDEVIFDSTSIQSNHDLYWKVIGKRHNELMIELKEMGYDENWTLKIEEVKYVIQRSNLRKSLQNQS